MISLPLQYTCGKVTNGEIYPTKLHQIGGSMSAKKCLKCPEHDRSELQEYMEEKKIRKKINYSLTLMTWMK